MTPIVPSSQPARPRVRFSYVPEIAVVLLALAATLVSWAGASGDRQTAVAAAGRPATVDIAHLAAVPPRGFHSLDTIRIGASDVPLAGRTAPLAVSRSLLLEVEGWSVDAPARSPSAAVYASIGGNAIVARSGIPRDDVATALNDPAYAAAGFALDVPPGALPLGRVDLVLRAATADAKGSYALEPAIKLLVTP